MKHVNVTIHIYDLVAALVFLGKKVKAADIANHIYHDRWSDIDKYDILRGVQKALDKEMAADGDHYGLRVEGGLYWLNYEIR